MPMSEPVSAGLGAGAAILGGILDAKAAKKRNDIANHWATVLEQLGIRGEQNMNTNLDAARDLFLRMTNGEGWTPEMAASKDSIGDQRAQLATLFQNQGVDPGLADVLSRLGSVGGEQQANVQDVLNNNISMRGQTGDSRTILERLLGGAMGEVQGMNVADDLGQRLLNLEGRTNLSLAAGDRGIDALNRGGFTNDTQFGSTTAGAIAGSGGRTNELQKGYDAILSEIGQGGETALTRALGQRGMDLGGREALLPMGLAATMARDQAARSIKQQAEGALRRAHARNGDAVSSGAGNDELAAFADQAAGLEADAVQKALLTQQDLQLKQQGQGLDAAAKAANLQNERYGQNIGGVSNLAKVEGDKVSSALNAIADLDRAATGRMGTTAGLGFEGEKSSTDRMALGGNLVNMNAKNRLDNLNAAMNPLQLEQNNMYRGVDSLLQSLGLSANTANQAGNLYLGQQGVNLNRASGQINADQGYLTELAKLLGLAQNNMQTGAQGMQVIGSNYGGLVNTGYGGLPGIIGGGGAPGGSGLGNTLMAGGLNILAGLGSKKNGNG